MIQTLHGAFASAHDLSNLRIGKVFNELEDQQGLPFRRKAADELQQRALLLRADQIPFGVIAPSRQDRQFIQRNFLPAAPVTVPVGDQIVGNAIQPRRKWNSSIAIILDVIHRSLEHTGGQVFRVVEVASAIVHIVEDAVYVLLVELTERVPVTQGRACQNVIFAKIRIRQR